MADESSIINIKLEYDDAINKIAALKGEMDALRAAEKQYQEQLKNGEITREEYNKLMADSKSQTNVLSESIRTLTRYTSNQIKQEKQQQGSLRQLRAELSNLTSSYDGMSRAERDSAAGKELVEHIQLLSEEIKALEEDTGRFQRNVGNYANSVQQVFDGMNKKVAEARERYAELLKAEGANSEAAKKAKDEYERLKSTVEGTGKIFDSMNASMMGFVTAGNPMAMMALNIVKTMGGMKNAMASAVQGVKMLAKSFWSLVTTPIGAAITAIVVAITALKKGITGSEAQMNRWRVAMAPLQKGLDLVTNAMTTMTGWLLKGVEMGGKFLDWILKAAEALPLVGDSIAEANRKGQDRVALVQEQIKYEQAMRDEIVKTAERENQISELRAKVADRTKYTAEERKKYLEEAIKLEEEQARRNKELAEQKLRNLELEGSFTENDAEMNNKLAEARAAVIKAETDYNNKVREMYAQRSELANQEKSAHQAAIKAAQERANKETEAIKQMEDALVSIISDGMARQREEITLSYEREIQALQKRLATENDLTAKARDAILKTIEIKQQQQNAALQLLDEERINKEVENRAKLIQLQLDGVKQGTEEEYNLRMQQLAVQREMELSEKGLTEEMKLAIVQKYNFLEQEETDKKNAAIKAKQVAAEQERIAELKRVADEEIKIEEAKYQAMSDITGGLIALSEALGESDTAFAKMAKVLALAEIAINTGRAIAKMVSAEAGKGIAGLATMAAGIATILTNIATAIKTVKSAKFATGGDVVGEGTGTSDSVPAMLSNGESVLTAAATSMFAPVLSAFNQVGGGSPIYGQQASNQVSGEDMLARAFAKGVENMPRPVVSVEEITRVSNRVEVLEKMSMR